MADGLPAFSLETGTNGAPYVIVGEANEVRDFEALVALAPNVMDPLWIRIRAQLANHMAKGFKYEVILEPNDFKKSYIEEYEGEDPDVDRGAGARSLRRYGQPDFDEISPPIMDGSTLVFYVVENYLGLPYHVEMVPGGEASYEPMGMLQSDYDED